MTTIPREQNLVTRQHDAGADESTKPADRALRRAQPGPTPPFCHRNLVTLLSLSGDDLTVARAAWASTGGESPEKLARMPELLARLARDGHHSPWEHTSLTFGLTTEVATHIHLLKHRVGVSINAASARYRELRDDRFYVPSDWPQELRAAYAAHLESALALYHRFVNNLVAVGIDRARAKESARFVRPYGAQLDYVVTFNMRSFLHFQKLRNSRHAQGEVREVAQEMLALVRSTRVFPHSLEAFGYGDAARADVLSEKVTE